MQRLGILIGSSPFEPYFIHFYLNDVDLMGINETLSNVIHMERNVGKEMWDDDHRIRLQVVRSI